MSGNGTTGPLGRQLQELRRRAGLTQQETADLAGLSVAGLRDVEQGRVVRPRAQTVRRLGVALGLSAPQIQQLLQLTRTGPAPVASVWIGVLGPLVAQVDGVEVDLGSATQQILLGLLALSPNQPVSRDVLIDAAWDGRQPPEVAKVLPTRMSRLRRRLQSRAAAPDAPVLTATGGGYQLTVSEEQLDLLAFRAQTRRARRRRSEGDLSQACDLFAEALRRWRGEPVAGLAALAEHPVVVGLVREWQAAVVEYATVATELGRYGEALPPLQQLVNADPLHEVAHARLMVVLAGVGQQATALTVFDTLRRRLADELGADPGPELARAHLQVLRQEVPRREVAPVSAHRQLPPDIADFSGRGSALEWLHERLVADPATAVSLVSIEGMGGVGKTRLAIHFAHRLLAAGEYADQQLYVDLHGHADEPPADPAAVLASFLHLLGVPGEQVPADPAARAALYRDRLSGTRALVLLDNAASEEQVRPLLPAGPGNLVLVTSRRALALDGAHTLPLEAFTPEEATGFLARVVGAGRVDADPAAAAQVVQRCGRLPLAVALVARRLQARPTWTLAEVAGRLADTRHRLDELAAGTRRLGAVFDLSYEALRPDAQYLFRLLGLHPGDDFTADSVAALADTSPGHTRRTLDHLVDENLVTVSPADHYRLHDLLRDYARGRAQESGPQVCRAAVGRVLEWYLATADAAQRRLFPDRRVLGTGEAAAATGRSGGFAGDEEAFGWLNAERANLVAAVALALEHGFWRAAWQLPAALRHFLERGGHWRDWLYTAEAGLAGARRDRERRGEALMLSDLGAANGNVGRLDRSVDLLTQAVMVSLELDDPMYEAQALNNLGIALAMSGQPAAAVDHLQRALDIVRELELPRHQAWTLSNLGLIRARLGQYREALHCLRGVVALQRGAADPVGLARSLRNLGEALRHGGEPAEAIRVLRQAHELHRRQYARADEAETLATLAEALDDVGEHAEAEACWRQALQIMQGLGHPYADQLRTRLSERPVTPSGLP